jgi:hypothetical protein
MLRHPTTFSDIFAMRLNTLSKLKSKGNIPTGYYRIFLRKARPEYIRAKLFGKIDIFYRTSAAQGEMSDYAQTPDHIL